MSDVTKAVFLSYAREDTAAAQRIAEALRSHGVEVWFDQSELRGGDAWDQKIRKQIKDCALVLPVISAHTQDRGEGYFRLEWKLAVERTHLMAEGVPFLAPVVVDDTSNSGAIVPPEFTRVQWTSLPGALPTPQFVAQVKRLLDAPRRPTAARGGALAGVADPGPTSARSATIRWPSSWMWAAVSAVLLGAVAYLVLRPTTKEPTAAAAAKSIGETKPAAPSPIANTPSPAATTIAAKSIAVLPFANFSPDKENEFFADGLHDEVITALTKIHDLKVISRTSVMAYRNPEGRNLKKIAADLGVATVLEGSVQRAGNKVHLNVQLIDAQNDNHLWADSYTKDLTDVFSVQAELATAVTTALKATLSPAEKTLIALRPTENAEAFDLYLRARTLYRYGNTLESGNEAIALCEQAVAKDPGFALAYAELAIENSLAYWDGLWDPSPERRERVRIAAETAVRLAPGLPQARLALGEYYYRVPRDWNRALAEYRLAEAGLPNDADLLLSLGFVERRLGRWSEALSYLVRAEAADPLNSGAPAARAQIFLLLRRFTAASQLAGQALNRIPGSPQLLLVQAAAQLEVDGDTSTFVRRLESQSGWNGDSEGVGVRYFVAMFKGDYDAAAHVLDDPRLQVVSKPYGDAVIADPVALCRATVSFLRGQHDLARQFADEAIAYFQTHKWAPRQEAWVRMGIAQAHACAGRAAEAVRDGQAAVAMEEGHDVLTTLLLQCQLGRIDAALDRREEAIAILRAMMTGPSRMGPQEVRHDPVWLRLKDDPRFEEILKSAKPL